MCLNDIKVCPTKIFPISICMHLISYSGPKFRCCSLCTTTSYNSNVNFMREWIQFVNFVKVSNCRLVPLKHAIIYICNNVETYSYLDAGVFSSQFHPWKFCKHYKTIIWRINDSTNLKIILFPNTFLKGLKYWIALLRWSDFF